MSGNDAGKPWLKDRVEFTLRRITRAQLDAVQEALLRIGDGRQLVGFSWERRDGYFHCRLDFGPLPQPVAGVPPEAVYDACDFGKLLHLLTVEAGG